MSERCSDSVQISDKLPENFGTNLTESQCRFVRRSVEAWEVFIKDSYPFRNAPPSPEYRTRREALTKVLREALVPLSEDERNELFEPSGNDIYERCLFDQALDAAISKLYATHNEHPVIREYISKRSYWQELMLKANKASVN